MQTQKIFDNPLIQSEDEEDRGEAIGRLHWREKNIFFDLFPGSNQLGRGEQNDVRLEDSTVSDVHADIDIKGSGEAMVKDLRSSNGTFVESRPNSDDFQQLQKKQSKLLKNDCIVRVGLVNLKFNARSPDQEPNCEEDYDVASSQGSDGKGVDLNLQGVVKTRPSMFDEPTQLPEGNEVGIASSKFDAHTMKPDGLSPPKTMKEKKIPSQIHLINDPTQDLGDDTESTHKQGENDNERKDGDIFNANTMAACEDFADDEEATAVLDQTVNGTERRASVESPTQILSDYSNNDGNDSETATEGQDDNDTAEENDKTLIENDSVDVNISKQDDCQSIVGDRDSSGSDSDAESDDIMMNSQAELNSDALQLILPSEVQEEARDSSSIATTDKKDPRDGNVSCNVAKEIGLQNADDVQVNDEDNQVQKSDSSGDNAYMTQVSPSKRVDIRVVENEARTSVDNSGLGQKLSRRSLSNQLEEAEMSYTKPESELQGNLKTPRADQRINTSTKENVASSSETSDNRKDIRGQVFSNELQPAAAAKNTRKRGRTTKEDTDDREEGCSGTDEHEEQRGVESSQASATASDDNEKGVRSRKQPAAAAKNTRKRGRTTKEDTDDREEGGSGTEEHEEQRGVESSQALATASDDNEKGVRSRKQPAAAAKNTRKRGRTTKDDVGDTNEHEEQIPPKKLLRNQGRNSSQAATDVDTEVGQACGAVHVLFTGVEPDDRLKKMIAKIEGKIVDVTDDVITHVITDGSLKRTPKLLISLNLGALYVVGVDWLEESAKQSPPAPMPISLKASPMTKRKAGKSKGSSYLVQDQEKEKKWAPFTLVKTLTINHTRAKDRSGGGIFDGMFIYIAKDVFGNKAPSHDEMRLIVESGNGNLLTTTNEITALKKNLKSEYKGGIVVVGKGETRTPAKAVVSFAQEFFAHGSQGIYTIEFLFSACMRQEVDYSVGIATQIKIA